MLSSEMNIENLNKLKRNVKNTKKALLSLEDVLHDIENKSKGDKDFIIYRDSAIKRFEYIIRGIKKVDGLLY